MSLPKPGQSRQQLRFEEALRRTGMTGRQFTELGPYPHTGYVASSFMGRTKELQITRAISEAKADGVGFVVVPYYMIPYTTASVTFDPAVRMVLEGSDPVAANVRAYGADHTGSITSTPAWHAARDNIPLAEGGTIEVPPGTYNLGTAFDFGSHTKLLIILRKGVVLTGQALPTPASNNSILDYRASFISSPVSPPLIIGTDPGGSETLRLGGSIRLTGSVQFEGASRALNGDDNDLQLQRAGSTKLTIGTTQNQIPNNHTLGFTASGGGSGGQIHQTVADNFQVNNLFSGGAIQLQQIGAGSIQLFTNGTQRWQVASTGALLAATDNSWSIGNTAANRPQFVYVASAVLPAFGSQGSPSYSFDTDTNTGMYRVGADVIGLSAGGSLRASISSGGIELAGTGKFIALSQQAPGTPEYTFNADTNTGMFQQNVDTIGFACGGSERFRIGPSTTSVIAGTFTVAASTVGIGTAAITERGLLVQPSLTGSTDQVCIASVAVGTSGGTAGLTGIGTSISTAAAAYTVTSGYGVRVFDATLGGGSAITTQYGLKIENQTKGGTNYALHTGTGAVRFGDFIEGPEISEPPAPAANNGRLYWRDNGSGKTQLVARFPTGAVQVVATEP